MKRPIRHRKKQVEPSVYPDNFEALLGFDLIREELLHLCENEVGAFLVGRMSFTNHRRALQEELAPLQEMLLLRSHAEVSFPSLAFAPLRELLLAIRPEGTYLPIEGVQALRQLLAIVRDLSQMIVGESDLWEELPLLRGLFSSLTPLPNLTRRIHNLIDEEGEIKDTASKTLREIRIELRRLEASTAGTMQKLLKQAQEAGWVEKGTTPAMRDGRLLLPIIPAAKREIGGIVHEESSTGKTLFLEPAQMVQLNNEIKEKRGEEKREIVRLLKELTAFVREDRHAIQHNCNQIGRLDFIHAKAGLAQRMEAVVPELSEAHEMVWYQARHPLLERRLRQEGRHLVPLNIKLSPTARLLLISGPNAGGKSVALKSVGLLQYMLQCGLAVPMQAHSTCTLFDQILLNIGDQQSIDNDLSTYSSHLKSMKHFMQQATAKSLILIDELGSGTEPAIGGAIAEGVLEQFRLRGTYGIVTTHYGNLKDYAEAQEGLTNGAMLFDRGAIRPLYELFIGQAGSSFAIEIARKIGLHEEVLHYAEELVGSDYMLQDKYLQDIMRDKAYWKNKREAVKRQEKSLEGKEQKLDEKLSAIQSKRHEIISKAEQEALQIIANANKSVERTIREIKESNAAKEQTKKARQALEAKREHLEQKRSKRKAIKERPAKKQPLPKEIAVGTRVSMRDGHTVGEVLAIEKDKAKVQLGQITMMVPLEQLRPTQQAATKVERKRPAVIEQQADERRLKFKPDLDCRGMRVDEAEQAVTYFIDEAVRYGYSPVRILHGTGTGALKNAIAELLKRHPVVKSFREEHVDFGGAGITVVEI